MLKAKQAEQVHSKTAEELETLYNEVKKSNKLHAVEMRKGSVYTLTVFDSRQKTKYIKAES